MKTRQRMIRLAVFLTLTIVFTAVSSYLTSWVKSRNSDPAENLADSIDWHGPNVGERVDLRGLKAINGDPFPELQPNGIILLTVVNPRCEMAEISRDLIEKVRLAAKARNVYVAMVSFSPDNEDFYAYATSKFDYTTIFSWQGEEVLASESLRNLVVPSHLILNDQNIVLNKFLGSSKDVEKRNEISNAITKTLDSVTTMEPSSGGPN